MKEHQISKNDARLDFYRQTSMFTDYGKFKKELQVLWRKKCKKSFKLLQYYINKVKTHRTILQMYLNGKNVSVYGDFSFIDHTTQMSDDDIFVTAPAMLSEIYRRDKKGFHAERTAKDRICVTCRYSSVLVSCILKANNIPCRCRAGWGNYFEDGFCFDHWVNEYWNEKQKRWIKIDMDDLYDSEFMQFEPYIKNKFCEHYDDFGDEYFISAAQAWINLRKDPNFYKTLIWGVSPAIPEVVVRYLFFDFLAVMGQELTFTFTPVAFKKKVENLTKSQLKQLDELANLMLDVDANFDKLKDLYDNTPEFRMIASPLVDPQNFKQLIKHKNYKIRLKG